MSINKQSNLSQAQQLFFELKVRYIDDLPSKFDSLERQILSLQTHSGLAEYPDFCRNLHSLKGSSGTYGLNILSTISHQLEEQMYSLNMSGSPIGPEVVGIWLELIDLMRLALKMVEQDQQDFNEIEHRLMEIQHRFYPNDLVVLLVSSSDYNASLCANMLEELGIRIVSLTSGYAALGRLLEQKFDFLVTSNELEGLCGRALIAALKLNPGKNQAIPQVLITSRDEILAPYNFAPDYVVIRDENFIASLTGTFKSIVKKLNKVNVDIKKQPGIRS